MLHLYSELQRGGAATCCCSTEEESGKGAGAVPPLSDAKQPRCTRCSCVGGDHARETEMRFATRGWTGARGRRKRRRAAGASTEQSARACMIFVALDMRHGWRRFDVRVGACAQSSSRRAGARGGEREMDGPVLGEEEK